MLAARYAALALKKQSKLCFLARFSSVLAARYAALAVKKQSKLCFLARFSYLRTTIDYTA